MKSFSIYLCVVTVLITMKTTSAQALKMYIGTYTSNSDSKGVYVYDFDEQSNETKYLKTIPMSNPSFLARKGDILYAVNEDEKGMVTVYNLAEDRVMSQASSGGAHPCHISLSPKDPIAIVSNYSSGTLSLFSLQEDGGINKMEDHLQFNGSSVDKARQNQSHIHSAFFSKDGSQVFVSDLGADLIYVFSIENTNGSYRFKKLQEIKTKLGGGPRHLVFSKDEKHFYSVLEITGEIEVFSRIGDKWNSKQIIPMYPGDFQGEQGGADVKIAENGKNLYATNRGTANLVYKYKINHDGLLNLESFSSVLGDSPRNVNISPSGNFIFVSNQISGNITIFNSKNSLIKKADIKLDNHKPVCVIF